MARTTNTGFKGISLRARGGYNTALWVRGTQFQIGTFKTLQEAVQARTEFITNLI